jgi:LuxR family quorum-sensing system transcriptional regulator CciR
MSLAKLAEEFGDAIAKATRLDELATVLAAVALELGFRYFALTHHLDIPRAPTPAVRLHNYPAGWAEYFDAHRLGPCDPVHRASHMTGIGFPWSRLHRLIQLTARDREILDHAKKSGIGDGFTVPAHIPGESAGSCSFATAAGHETQENRLYVAQLVGGLAFEAARRLVAIRSPLPDRPQLTDRQRECVYWAARGKTDPEIASILGISHETVILHLKQARARYGVYKRTQLAVHALFDGTLSFVDLLGR